MTPDAFVAEVVAAVLDRDGLVQATIKPRSGRWQRIEVRPVIIRGAQVLQFARFDEKQAFFDNHAYEDAEPALRDLLSAPLRAVRLELQSGTVDFQVSKKGKVIRHDGRPAASDTTRDLSHDRSKPQPFTEGEPNDTLAALGILTQDGRVRADMRRKFRQVNEFVALFADKPLATAQAAQHGARLRIYDCGCGSSYLTLALYHYLNDVRAVPAEIVGLDVDAHVIEKSAQTAVDLGFDGAAFCQTSIADYDDPEPVDVVLALHACDTASDEAIALGLRANASVMLIAPCCHHDIQTQMARPDEHAAVLQHGILTQRLGDILTDTLRAQVLRVFGYQTDVFEFVGSEHTNRNLMIRALRRTTPQPDPRAAADYRALATYWGVTPHLATLLGAALDDRLTT